VTDRQIERQNRLRNSALYHRCALKGAKVSVLNAVILFLRTVLVLEGRSRIKIVGLDLELGSKAVA